jgi:biotin carboxylase
LARFDAALQVEHPVTEGITETNIPSIQLMVGMGIPLWRIACVRATFNKDPNVSWFRCTDCSCPW